ncbi:hypothetical protein Acr_13g0003710 [Actinidia rufa]|uniref:AMP-dependent synthetase/ligase domain-containing protein n=1 Tax=Actinidia rufa TaxID=165716 RepID=A0A7J0FJV6_9ERIC|nr:hypothetical protein Acr_13g0003710 [Actinidia rufa]
MDPKILVEDQFSKLHPCFPVNTRIGIIGGGPSGLSAAYALSKLGYNNVTVLEKYHTVSGMCESIDIEGKIYDLGGQVLAANSAPVIFSLAKEIGSELVELDSHKLALIDSSTGKYQDIKVADDYVSVISLTLELQDKTKDSGRIGVHAISDFASDLTPVFLEDRGFKSVPKSVAYGYTASGYGFVQDMPYAYIHDEVLAVRRSSCGVSVDVRNSCEEVKLMEFDKIIISGSFPFKNGKTYRSSQSNLAENEYGKGLIIFQLGFITLRSFMSDPETIGNPVAMQRFYRDTDIFLFWSYGNSADITGPRITELAIDALKIMGGMVEKVILQRRFTYFPHVRSQDMKEGFYDKLETQLQGQQNTYYVGGLMAFELTERNSSYAMALVCKHFASDTSLPVFPYVKRLIQLQSDCWDRNPKELREYQGVDFPDLCSLDGYLKHWGSHKVTQNKTLYTWINEEGGPAYKRTYGELHANASCIAQKLLGSRKPVIKPGDRVLLVHVPGLDFVDAFFGCLRARVLPVPVLPPDPLQRGGQALLKIENIAKSCNAVAILSTIGYHGAVRAGAVKNLILLSGKNRKSSGKWPDLPWLHTDSWVKNSKNMLPEDIDDSEAQASDLCFLQFTSGSTDKMMIIGGSAVLFSPITFIKNPLLWLQIMSKYQATHSAGPNFAFELVVRRLEAAKDRLWNYDLSSMVFLMVAAEPVRQKTLKRFVELTSSFGLSQKVMAPGYGLAEKLCFYDVDVDIRIVDPETGVEREEAGKEGEIWISSPSAGIGYWGREELNVEKTVESSSELIRPGCCAVIGVPEDILSTKGMSVPDSSDQVGLVVIAEVRDGKPVPKDVIEHIQTRVAKEHGVTVASVKLIKPRTISKTTSGKIKRFECLKQYADGTLNLVPEPILSKKSLLRSFTTGTCREGKTPRAQFVRGPPSPTPKLTQKLSDFLGVPVGAVDIFTATCIEELASFSEDLLKKSQPKLTTNLSHLPEPEIDSAELYTISLAFAPLAWILCIFLTCICIAFFDPSLVSIGDGAVIAEGALIQGHEKTEAGRPASKSNIQKSAKQKKGISDTQAEAVYHFMGIYTVGFLSSLSAAVLYFLYIRLSQKPPSPQHFALVCIFGAFHWLPFAIIAYATMIGSASSTPNSFAISIAFAYVAHGLILSFLTGLATHILHRNQQEKQSHLKTWLRHRITIACHLRFARLLSGTETFCMYLRLLGAKVGKHCSIRAINPVSEPELISIGDGVHLGDFSRIIAGFYSSSGFSLWQSRVMIKNTMHTLDERIEEMDTKYKKIVGNLAANLAATTLKVRTRYFHRIGVSGKGVLKLYDNIKGLPDHKIFHPGKSYPIVVRHSNSLSADDDARIDARGAALRILSDETGAESSELPLLDLTLKTGNAFYARTISDFCNLACVWGYLQGRSTLFRFTDGQEMYVKFKLRPSDEKIGEDSGKVEPTGVLPPETGAIPRAENDTRPLLFLVEDFQRRVNSPGGVHYIFQLQFRPIPQDEAAQDIALDCTKPWDDTEFPIIDVGEIVIDQNLTGEQSEELVFNPFLRCPEIDVIRATSASQSASIDHGRSLIYEICQRLRNGDPLPESWRIFLEQSDVKVNLSGCPMAAALENNETRKVTLERPWTPLSTHCIGCFPLFWVSSGILAAFACVVGKWVLVGKKKEDKTMLIWSSGAFMDTIWQAFRTVVGDYFMEMASGSVLFVIWMKLMGSEIDLGAYVDSMEAVLNPEMVEIERGGFVGSRAVVMPGVRVETGGRLSSLSLAMKEEIVKSR